ncbi:NAD(P)-dependent oxidoreductase [Sulfitobacter mediterraneus]|nr:NAD(P)-dependent oxidoreductase [Sulfitobacter mediterraneus]MBM1639817.1 NAD(P)-dependent oxidoreductase [Sulfitobacter mediterraneus]MBM1643866.1 NAD(P)-dependent oxidoreductase [Sulfitobacter mediterraneus]MBM1647912.1 NAD(P)-dependent oxidoreductase [Sulfitobacter mediterraneus]MBM1651957.1 NAD(P)-dependent oxidoreductase [Sulfitobacter mediterraneus]
MAKLAFLGLGVMGAPMAGHLQKAGHEVTVYNRTASKAEDWAKTYGGQAAATPREAAQGAECVMACVGNDDDLRSVCVGDDGAFAGMDAGAIFVDHTTVSAAVTRELYAAADAAQISFVDAPISGGQAGAENAQLSIMCGGDQGAFDRALPVMEVYSKICRRIGDSGAGQMTKMCNQIAIAGVVQGLSEALHFAEKAGLDGRAVVEVISQGAAGSWQMANRYETMLDNEFDHGFAVDWMRKDLGICLDTADETGASLPITALVDQFYKDVQKIGGGRWDTSSLIQRLRALDGTHDT